MAVPHGGRFGMSFGIRWGYPEAATGNRGGAVRGEGGCGDPTSKLNGRTTMTPSQISDFLSARVELFKQLSSDRLADLVGGARVVSYEPNEAVVEFGEDASFLGVLLEGELAVSVPGGRWPAPGDRALEGRRHLRRNGADERRQDVADFIAETRCQVLRIPDRHLPIGHHDRPARRAAHLEDHRRALPAGAGRSDKAAAAAFRRSEDPYGLCLKGERPEKLLVINCGSSSLKYSFFDTANEAHTARGQVERIGAQWHAPCPARAARRGDSAICRRGITARRSRRCCAN